MNEQSEFWSKVADKYDRVVDLQIGPKTRSSVRDRLAKEGRLGKLAEFGCGTGYYTQLLAEKRTASSLLTFRRGCLKSQGTASMPTT